MRIANTKDGKPIKPSPGDRAFCPGCGGVMIAKCGEVVDDYWAHESLEGCDHWTYEPITEWHLEWQNQFAPEQREVYIKKYGENHRADVLTRQGVVLEFQNSLISVEDIEEREHFYGERMFWVINAGDLITRLEFKEFTFDLTKMTFRYIIPYFKDDAHKSFGVKVPDDDWKNVIIPALKKAKFERQDEETSDGYEYWIGYKKDFYDDSLSPIVAEAFQKYHLHSCLFVAFDDDRDSRGSNFRWKRLRQSWLRSRRPKFLDLNNGYLFWIKTLHDGGYGYGRFLTKNSFLRKYK